MLLKRGDFKLHSGEESKFIIDCDALDDEDVATCAMLIAAKIGYFTAVGHPKSHEGSVVPRLYEAMKPYMSEPRTENRERIHRLLIVDDVFTTGNSLNEVRDGERFERGSYFDIVAAVIFARKPCPDWINPIFQML